MTHPKLGIHLSHCNFGEHIGSCKYGNADCPALTNEWSWFGLALQKNNRVVKELHAWLDKFAGNAVAHYMANALWQEISAIVAKYDTHENDHRDEEGVDTVLDVVMADRHKLKIEVFELKQHLTKANKEIDVLNNRINSPVEAHLCNNEVWRPYPSAVCSCCRHHTDSIHHENLLDAVNRLQKLVFEKSK